MLATQCKNTPAFNLYTYMYTHYIVENISPQTNSVYFKSLIISYQIRVYFYIIIIVNY